MGAFRLKDRFWTDFGDPWESLWAKGGTMNPQNGPQVSPQRLPESFLGVKIGAGNGETHFVGNCATVLPTTYSYSYVGYNHLLDEESFVRASHLCPTFMR